MDFQLTSEQKRLQHKCRELAADFASRSGLHDRDASHPVENYDRLRKEGFLGAVSRRRDVHAWGPLDLCWLQSRRSRSAGLFL